MAKSNATRTIGFVSPYVSGVYYGNVLTGAIQAAQRGGARLMVFQESAAQLERTRLAWDQIDGWIVVLATDGSDQLARAGAPVATISTPAPNLPAVCADNQSGTHAAVALTTDLDLLNTAFDLLEQAGTRQLASAPDTAAPDRLAQALRVLRAELLRARVMREAVQVRYLDNIIRANNEISTALLEDADAAGLPLDWLRHSPAIWGCLSLWSELAGQRSLAVSSVYARYGRSALSVGAQYPPDAFLSADALPAPVPGEPDIVMLLPVRTAQHDWGVLALAGVFETRFTWSGDPIAMWAEMLSAALERGALLAELKNQQHTLQAGYERELALTDAVREIGSPIIPLMPGVLLVPLIGALDSRRARQVMTSALEHVRSEHATDLLIDVTGVPIIDTQVAAALLQLARMVGLLGARTVLVGVRPEIAQSIVGLGIDLAGIGTSPTLAAAIRSLQQRERAPRSEAATSI
jgi:anti-anti-sigma regulatory factor